MTSGFITEGNTNGQIPVWSNTGWMWAPLNPGTNGQVLTISGGIPVWGNASAQGLPDLQDMNGVLDIANGGTGQTTANGALNALLPNQGGNANKILGTDGTNATWISQISSPVTSVFGRVGGISAANGDYNFSQISGSAVANQLPNLENLNGVLDILHGGTGQTTTTAALNALLPSQGGNANKILGTDGTNATWISQISSPISSVFGRTGAVISASGDYNFSQITGSATAGQLPNLENLNGILDILHGGTGQTTANAALNALLPSQTGNGNKILGTDGTNATWISQTSIPVSSVFGRTGTVISANGDYNFSQITGSATASQLPNLQNLNGVLDILHGGTGQTTANAALNALLPNQTGNANKILETDGTNATWISQTTVPVFSVFGRTGAVVAAIGDYDFSQISGNASANQIPNLQNLNGILDIAHGGTGQTTTVAALNALLPSQPGNINKILGTDGTNATWISQTTAPVSSVFGRVGTITAANGDYNFSQISGSVTASQLPDLQNLNGLLDIAHGGTGQATANDALNALLPSQTGNTNKILQTNGTSALWVDPPSAPVSSVFGRTGLVISATGDYSFSQISGAATADQIPNLENLNGIVDITHGGTGQTTVITALNALLPSQIGNENKILGTDGTNATWISQVASPVSSVFGRVGAVTAANGDYNFSQISGSAVASQLPNLENLNGVLDITHGGTGQTTAITALNALLPTQTGNENKILGTDGTNATWISQTSIPVSSVFGRTGTVTSANGDYSFSQISGNATAAQLPNIQNLNGLLDVSHGGTGLSNLILGDMLYASSADVLSALSGNLSTTRKFLTQTGAGSISAAPAWNTIAPSDLPVFVGSGSSHSAGAVPDPGASAGTTKFLREDGTWQSPSSGNGTVTSVGLSMPGEFSTGSAITTSGSLSAAWVNQTTNKVFASPDGSSGAPSFRALSANDISFGMISYGKIQSVAANSLLGNNTGSAATAIELSAAQVKTMLALNNVENTTLSTWVGSSNIITLGTITTGTWNATIISPTKGGTGISSYTLGDILYGGITANTLSVLSGNTSSTKKFLTQTGTGSASAAPSWNTITATDIPLMIASGASHAAGAVPDPGSTAGTTKFLREDGTWQVPSGGSGSPAGSNTEVQYNNSGAFGSSGNFIYANGGVSVTNSSTTDEQFSIFGKVTGSSTNQIAGLWGNASNTATTNTGTIGVLATGNSNTTAGQTNVALQINDGEFAMGRTSQAPGTGTAVEAATAGTAYTQEGPSGVIEVDFKGAADQSIATNIFDNFVSGITINNRYVTANSIILVEVLAQSDGTTNQAASAFATKNVTFTTSVRARAAGSFVLTVDIHNATGGNITLDGGAASTDKDKIRIGYTVINPGK
jgi:hypothetical protein